MKKSGLIKLIFSAVLVVALATALLFVYKNYKEKFVENKKTVAYTTDVQLAEDETLFILENEVYSYNIKKANDKHYIQLDTAIKVFGMQFDVDTVNGVAYYTLPTMNLKLVPDSDTLVEMVIPGFEANFDRHKNLITVDGKLYIDTDFVERYADLSFSFYEKPDRAVVYYKHGESLYYTLKDTTPFHSEMSIKSDIYELLPAGTKVHYISGTGNAGADFYRIMTEDGRYGYVQNKHLSASFYETWESDFTGPVEKHIFVEGPIRLGWHYTASQKGNETYKDVVKNTEGMNVYSPRWMYVADNSGNIVNYGEVSYVEKAHAAGYQVWVLVQDFDGPENLDIAVLLADREARKRLAENMVNETVLLGADGINLDLEEVNQKSAKDFVQFIKELSILAHSKGLVLSVDNLVPLGYNTYELGEQAKYADYIVIMAYDEHYAGSSEAGSVASIGYTRKAIANTAAQVPKNQIVISVPFYTRLWETDSKGSLSSSAVSMLKANAHVEKNKLEKKWDSDVCQNYVTYSLSGITYQMWLEDNESLKIKLEAIQNAGVAGMAAWRLGFEEDDTWDLITSIIK